jgi:hypothetical protein
MRDYSLPAGITLKKTQGKEQGSEIKQKEGAEL